MRGLILLLGLLAAFESQSQNRSRFYLELVSAADLPQIVEKKDGSLDVNFLNSAISQLFDNYTIYTFQRVSSVSKNEHLKRTFIVECNSLELMSKLILEHSSFVARVEQYDLPYNGGIFYTPNDFSLLAPLGYEYEQNYLKVIKAEQAWDITHGSPDVLMGISDTGFEINHEEVDDKNVTVLNPGVTIYPGNWHGHGVMGLAGAETNNGVGFSSVGFDTGLAFTSMYGTPSFEASLLALSEAGARVVNASWYSGLILDNGGPGNPVSQSIIDDINGNGTVVVVAAGNGPGSGPPPSVINAENYAKRYYYPASYRDVISVSTVGEKNMPYTTTDPYDDWINVHKIKTIPGTLYANTSISVTESEIFNQHNDSVDIVVPSYRVPVVGAGSTSHYWGFDNNGISGTSFSAPIVTGTVGLMFSVNKCLKPKEVETILKLTATDIENMPENAPFYGRLGAGSLNAYKAVEMANEMAKPLGNVVVEDRILYRRWFYKLETAPFRISMQNNVVRDGAKLKFFARKEIEVLSGDYKPDDGYISLQIDSGLSLDCDLSPRVAEDSKQGKIASDDGYTKLYPNPNNGTFTLKFSNKIAGENTEIWVFDLLGKQILNKVIKESEARVDLQSVPSGVYMVKIRSQFGNETLKFMKY